MILNGSVTNGVRAPFRRAVISPRLGAACVARGAAGARWHCRRSAGKLPLERLFAAPDLSGPTLRGVKISPDGKLVAYLRARDDDKDRFDLWAYDVAANHATACWSIRARSPARTRALSAEEEARRERQRTAAYSGIVEYSFAPDSRHLLIPLNGDLYVYDLGAQTRRRRAPAHDHRRLTKPTRASRRARIT